MKKMMCEVYNVLVYIAQVFLLLVMYDEAVNGKAWYVVGCCAVMWYVGVLLIRVDVEKNK